MRKGGAFVLLFLVTYVMQLQHSTVMANSGAKSKGSTVNNPNKPDDFNESLVALDKNIPEEH